jgi:hypothetical protein
MNKFNRFSIHFILILVFGMACVDGRTGNAFAEAFQICQTTGQAEALKERGKKITHIKDDLIRRTVQAYGGDYIRSDTMTAFTLNGKTYKDFTVEVVDDKYLLIQTPDDTFYMELGHEPTPPAR